MRIVTTVLLALLTSSVLAQISLNSVPKSFDLANTKSLVNHTSWLPPLDLEAIRAEDRKSDYNNRIAVAVPFDFNLKTQGQLTVLQNGDKIWRAQVILPNAMALFAVYKNFFIPKGAQLHMYNPNKTQVLGGYSNHNNSESRQFMTGEIKGTTFILEYYEPRHIKASGNIELYRLYAQYAPYHEVTNEEENRLYSAGNEESNFASSAPCHVNVNCKSENNQLYKATKQSVMRILITTNQGIGLCSGALINNTRQDKTPYVLSAYHCQTSGTPNFSTFRFDFNYESSSCTTPSSEPGFQSMTGCSLISKYFQTDLLLMRLFNQVPESYCPVFAGWNRSPQGWGFNSYGIHHPRGDIKKISLYGQGLIVYPSSISWGNYGTTPPNHHISGYITEGFSEGGSSGSPIFNGRGEIVGQLHGGGGFRCNEQSISHFGRLAVSWEGGGSSSSRLREHLDPTNSGVMSIGYLSDCIASPEINMTGSAFIDLNKNAIWDNGEPPMDNVTVNAVNNATGESTSTQTNSAGEYTMKLASNTNYTITFDPEANWPGFKPATSIQDPPWGNRLDQNNSRTGTTGVSDIIVNGGYWDIQAPTLIQKPEDRELNCGESIPVYTSADFNIEDNFDTDVNINLDTSRINTADGIRFLYLVTAQDDFENEVIDSVVFTPATPPVTDVNSTIINLCGDKKSELSVSVLGGNAPYKYEWSSTDGSFSASNEQNPSFTTDKEGTVQVISKVTDSKQCTIIDTVNINTSYDKPTLEIIGQNVYCINDTIKLNSNLSGWKHNWIGPDNFQSLDSSISIVANTITKGGNYTLEASNEYTGCTTSQTIQVKIIDNEKVSLNGADVVCLGDTIILSSGVQANHKWKGPNNFSSSDIDLVVPSETFGVGKHLIEVQVSSDNCPFSGSKEVEVINVEPLETSVNQFVCPGDEVRLTTNGTNAIWTTPDGSQRASNEFVISEANQGDEGYYSLVAINADGCKVQDSVQVSLKPFNALNPQIEELSCDGLTATLYESVQADEYLWKFGTTEKSGPKATFDKLQPGTDYQVTLVTQQEGCTVEKDYSFTTKKPVSLTLETTQKSCEQNDGRIQIKDDVPNNVSLRWTDNNSTSHERTNLDEGTYTLEATLDDCIYDFSATIGNGCDPIVAGTVFLDYNKNNKQDNNEPPLENVSVQLFYKGDNQAVADELTDAQGQYQLTMEKGLDFRLVFELPNDMQGYTFAQTGSLQASGSTDYIQTTEETFNYLISVPLQDIEAPIITNKPISNTFHCEAFTPPGNPTISDNDGSAVLERDSIIFGAVNKPDSIQYTWSVKDKSGNTVMHQATSRFNYHLPVNFEDITIDLCKQQELQLDLNLMLKPSNLAYEWDIDGKKSNEPKPIFVPNTPGEYTITFDISTPFQCAATGSFKVKAKQNYTFTIVGDTAICQGEPFTLTGEEADEIIWQTPTGETISGKSLKDIYDVESKLGTYLAIGTFGNYCIDTLPITVREKTRPQKLEITGNTNYCEGELLGLTTMREKVLWSVNGQTYNEDTLRIDSETLGTGLHLIKVSSNGTNCADTGQITIEILPKASFEYKNSAQVCFGKTITLGLQGSDAISWTGPNGFTTNQKSFELKGTSNVAGAYIFTATNSVGCSLTDTIQLTVKNCVEGPDIDKDFITDADDIDNDNDGIPDFLEGEDDLDGDGIPNYLDQDSDNDGIPDLIEAGFVYQESFKDLNEDGLNDLYTSVILIPADPDGDGIPNPYDLDSDNDGILDIVESRAISQYTAADGKDNDQDGFQEIFILQKKKFYTPIDSDFDGLPDFVDTDSDGDKTSDNLEAFDEDLDMKSDKVASGQDSDNDGIDDAFDTMKGFGSQPKINFPVATGSLTPLFRYYAPTDVAVRLTIGRTFEDCFGLNTAIHFDYDNEHISESTNGSCIQLKGEKLGLGFNRVIACGLNDCDTVYYRILVNTPTVDTIYADFGINNQAQVCFDTSEVGANVIVEKICDHNDPNFEEVEITTDLCVFYEGTTEEKISQCYVLCNDYQVCDTFVVLFNETILRAEADNFNASAGKTVFISPLNNDLVPQGSTIKLVKNPRLGRATVKGNQIEYQTDLTLECGLKDTIMYEVSHKGRTVSAPIFVDISCRKITPFNGFSPDNDGVNDGFIIENIDNYPDNEVYIYNKAGNLVFGREGYSNSDPWKGNTNGKDLPDGVYFYIIHLNNDVKSIFHGYTVLFRG